MVSGWCPDGVDGFSFLAKGGTFAVNPDGFRKVPGWFPDGIRMANFFFFFFFFLSREKNKIGKFCHRQKLSNNARWC
jgi:hypothetical protein